MLLMDEVRFAPLKKPWNASIPLRNYQQAMASSFKLVRDFLPQYYKDVPSGLQRGSQDVRLGGIPARVDRCVAAVVFVRDSCPFPARHISPRKVTSIVARTETEVTVASAGSGGEADKPRHQASCRRTE